MKGLELPLKGERALGRDVTLVTLKGD